MTSNDPRDRMPVRSALFRHSTSLRFASLLNIGGLAIALAVFLIIVIQLRFEWGYDQSYKKSNRIFRIETLFPMSLEYSAQVPQPLGEMLKDQVAEIEDYFLLQDRGNWATQVNGGKGWGEKFYMQCMATSASLIHILDIEISQGDGKQALTRPNMCMVPESFVRKWCPGPSALGQQIRIGGEQEFTIGAVYKDLPKNSVFTNVCYISHTPPTTWEQWEGQLFVLTKGKDRKQLQKSLALLPITPLQTIYEGLHKEEQRLKEEKSYLKVTPLTDVYYEHAIYDILAKGDLKRSYLMLGVGLLVIFIAMVNFVNFTLSLAPARMKAINTRKVLGAGSRQLKMQFVVELMSYVGIAYLLALLLMQLVAGLGGNHFLSVSLDISQNPGSICIVGAGILIVGLIAGYYPACYTTSFPPAMVLKGNFVHTPRGIAFRNGLSIFQFTISVILIACAILMVKQNSFMQAYSVGYKTENIGWTKLDQGFTCNSHAILEELRQVPGMEDYTFSDFIPGGEFIKGQGVVIEEMPVKFDIWCMYHNFLQFFGIQLLQGDSISVYNQNQSQLLMNERALQLFPALERYQGKTLPVNSNTLKNNLFIGVINDIHYLSLHKPVEALMMVYSPANSFSTLFFKLSPGNQLATIQQIREIFDRLAPESMFEFHFLDDTLQQSYEQEHRLTAMVSFLSGLAIFLALVGIYGMIVYQTTYRRKEIAIRKVNGATEWETMLLLNKKMLYQWLTGFLLACPVAYYIMELWLRSFSYHTTIRIWMFVLSGILVLLILLFTVFGQSIKAARANPVRELNKE